MFPKLFVSALAATLAMANPVRRAQGIAVALSAPEQVTSLDELKLTATVSNTGAEEVRVLKYNTILDSEIPTRSFRVNKDGTAVNFTGVAVCGITTLKIAY
jgi:deuterolysin